MPDAISGLRFFFMPRPAIRRRRRSVFGLYVRAPVRDHILKAREHDIQ